MDKLTNNDAEIISLRDTLEPHILHGDYITLGMMLNLSSIGARKRFKRAKRDAVNAMAKLIDTRNELIKKYRETR